MLLRFIRAMILSLIVCACSLASDSVAIVMAVWNGSTCLHDSIGSVLAQHHGNWNLYIADDASTDDTFSILSRYREVDPRIHVVRSERNVGVGEARNLALQEAYHNNPRFLAAIDCDDWWFPYRLSKQIDFMQAQSLALSYGSMQAWNAETGRVSPPITIRPQASYSDLLRYNWIPLQTIMLDVTQTGPVYFPAVRRMEDIRLWLKVMKEKGFAAKGLAESLVLYRLSAGSLSHDKRKMAAERIRVLREQGVSGLNLASRMLYYAVRGLWRNKIEYRTTQSCPAALALFRSGVVKTQIRENLRRHSSALSKVDFGRCE